MSDPTNIFALDEIKLLTGLKIEVVVASEPSIQDALDKYFSGDGPAADILSAFNVDGALGEIEDAASNTPIVRLFPLILVDALKKNASQIVIHVAEGELWFLYRIAGQWIEVMKRQHPHHPIVIDHAVAPRRLWHRATPTRTAR